MKNYKNNPRHTGYTDKSGANHTTMWGKSKWVQWTWTKLKR